ncbi:molecular chaperone [Lecanicillium sp. MT-2017a]|nr:molecular chaperone [Lecanicillium sp. MT-2017a]
MRTTVATTLREASWCCTRCRIATSRRAFTIAASANTRAASTTPSLRAAAPLVARTQPTTTTPPPGAPGIQNRAFSSSSTDTPEATSERREEAAAKPPPPATHYDIFPSSLPSGPPPAGPFHIDTRTLRREFLQLQARAHPDMHPASDKARAEATSARINEAFKTLANPLLRAQYLLSLRGVDVANDETLKVEEPELLMLVLEAREEIEDAQSEADLEEPRRVNEERILEGEKLLEKAFIEDDIEAAKREAVRMRYWVNIRDSLDNWEQGKPVVLEH